jgi:hypothetical protein
MKRLFTWSSASPWAIGAGWIIWLALLGVNGLPVAAMAIFGAAGMATNDSSKVLPMLAMLALAFASVAVFSGWLVARKLPVLGAVATFLALPVHFAASAVALHLLEGA